MLSYSNLNTSLVIFSQVCSITFIKVTGILILICLSIKGVILYSKAQLMLSLFLVSSVGKH